MVAIARLVTVNRDPESRQHIVYLIGDSISTGAGARKQETARNFTPMQNEEGSGIAWQNETAPAAAVDDNLLNEPRRAT